MSSTSFPVTFEPVPPTPPKPLIRTGSTRFSSARLWAVAEAGVSALLLELAGVPSRLLVETGSAFAAID